MTKPPTQDGYNERHTAECERLLVTLLRGLGPWKDSVCLIGGLTPRYLVRARPPDVPAHAGTLDVDIVVDLQILTDIAAYHTLESNLRKMGFERAVGKNGAKLSWRWQKQTQSAGTLLLELLVDAPAIAGGRVQPLPTDNSLSALNIPNASIVFDHHDVIDVGAELLDGDGWASERIRYANLVSFTCLKAFAFDQRFERKDAHDLVYCLEHAGLTIDQVAEAFQHALVGKHGTVIKAALGILRNRFTGDGRVEGYRKDGPVAVAKFESGVAGDERQRDIRLLRQRQVCDVIENLLARIAAPTVE